MGKKKLLVVGLLVAILAVAAVWLTRPKPPTWTLPDGSTLRLVKVKCGTNIWCGKWSGLTESLYRVLPDKAFTKAYSLLKLRARMYTATHTLPPSSPECLILLEWRGKALPPRSSGFGPDPWPFDFSIADEHGVEPDFLASERNWGFPWTVDVLPDAPSKTGSAGTKALLFVELPYYPATSRFIHIRGYWRDTNGPPTLIGEARVRNGGYERRPIMIVPGDLAPGGFGQNQGPTRKIRTMEVKELPITCRPTNGLEVTLVKLECGLPNTLPSPEGHVGDRISTCCRATLIFRENGRPTTNWFVQGGSAMSLHGKGSGGFTFGGPYDTARSRLECVTNSVVPGVPSTTNAWESVGTLEFPCALWPDEPCRVAARLLDLRTVSHVMGGQPHTVELLVEFCTKPVWVGGTSAAVR